MELNLEAKALEGEPLVLDTKMVVSPSAGIFEPEQVQGRRISAGQIVGYVVNPSERVPIKSPFEGIVEAVTAWPEERVRKYQSIMALLAPSPEVAI